MYIQYYEIMGMTFVASHHSVSSPISPRSSSDDDFNPLSQSMGPIHKSTLFNDDDPLMSSLGSSALMSRINNSGVSVRGWLRSLTQSNSLVSDYFGSIFQNRIAFSCTPPIIVTKTCIFHPPPHSLDTTYKVIIVSVWIISWRQCRVGGGVRFML